METVQQIKKTTENINENINKFKIFLDNQVFVKLINLIKIQNNNLKYFQYKLEDYYLIQNLSNDSLKDLIKSMDFEYEELIASVFTKDYYLFDKYLLSDVQTHKENKTYISDIFEELLTIYDTFKNDYLKLYFDEEGHLHFEATEAINELYEDIDKYKNSSIYSSNKSLVSLYGLSESILYDINRIVDENHYYIRACPNNNNTKEKSLIQRFEDEDGNSYLNENYYYLNNNRSFRSFNKNTFHIVFKNPIDTIENAFFVPRNNYRYLRLLLNTWDSFIISILEIVNKINILAKLIPHVIECLTTFFDRIDYELNDTIHEYYCRLDKQDLLNNLVSNIQAGIRDEPYKRFFLPLNKYNGFVFGKKIMYSYLKDDEVVVVNPLFHEQMTDYQFLKPVEIDNYRFYHTEHTASINNETIKVSTFIPDNHLDILKEKGVYVEEIEHYLEHEESILANIDTLNASVLERYKEYSKMYYQKVQFIRLNDKIVKISINQDDNGNDILKYSHMTNYRLGTSYVLNTKPEYIEIEELIKLYLNKEIPKESQTIVANYIVTSGQKIHEQVMDVKLKDIVDKIDESYYVYVINNQLVLLIIDNQVYSLMLTSQPRRLIHIQRILNHTLNKSIESVKVFDDVMSDTPHSREQRL